MCELFVTLQIAEAVLGGVIGNDFKVVSIVQQSPKTRNRKFTANQDFCEGPPD